MDKEALKEYEGWSDYDGYYDDSDVIFESAELTPGLTIGHLMVAAHRVATTEGADYDALAFLNKAIQEVNQTHLFGDKEAKYLEHRQVLLLGR